MFVLSSMSTSSSHAVVDAASDVLALTAENYVPLMLALPVTAVNGVLMVYPTP
jgi:hypothetical protein